MSAGINSQQDTVVPVCTIRSHTTSTSYLIVMKVCSVNMNMFDRAVRPGKLSHSLQHHNRHTVHIIIIMNGHVFSNSNNSTMMGAQNERSYRHCVWEIPRSLQSTEENPSVVKRSKPDYAGTYSIVARELTSR